MEKIKKTEAQWLEMLTEHEFSVCRKKGTERAFSGEYWQVDGKAGCYVCRCCHERLFDAAAKFDSGSGWPSFTQAIEDNKVSELHDVSMGMTRVEVTCARCDSHLGHVFSDGPAPTGMRYCINSASLKFDDNN